MRPESIPTNSSSLHSVLTVLYEFLGQERILSGCPRSHTCLWCFFQIKLSVTANLGRWNEEGNWITNRCWQSHCVCMCQQGKTEVMMLCMWLYWSVGLVLFRLMLEAVRWTNWKDDYGLTVKGLSILKHQLKQEQMCKKCLRWEWSDGIGKVLLN